MSQFTFFLRLALTAAGTAAILLILHLFPEIAPYWRLSAASIVFFILLTFSMFFVARNAVRSSDPNSFTRVSLLFVFVKLVAALAFIVLYDRLISPDTVWFVLPFLMVYVLFTIFEVHFMMVLSREKK